MKPRITWKPHALAESVKPAQGGSPEYVPIFRTREAEEEYQRHLQHYHYPDYTKHIALNTIFNDN